jgi:hypothetical protein
VVEVPLEEKNDKKQKAVAAAKEHGGQLFAEGKYEHAYAVYERGLLIINGIFGASDSEYDALAQLELILHLNMAACALKLNNFKSALENSKSALSFDKTNIKVKRTRVCLDVCVCLCVYVWICACVCLCVCISECVRVLCVCNALTIVVSMVLRSRHCIVKRKHCLDSTNTTKRWQSWPPHSRYINSMSSLRLPRACFGLQSW